MSTLRNTMIVCSDVHSYYANAYNRAHRLMTLYREEIGNGTDVHYCGDFGVTTGGLFNAAYWVPNYKILLDEWADLGGIITAGNHDSGNNYGTINVTDNGIEYTPAAYWRHKTGCDDNLIIQRTTNDGKDILLSISDNSGSAAGISDSAIAYVKDVVQGNPDRRIIILIHYPTWLQVDSQTTTYTATADGVTTSYSIPLNAYATRYGTGQTGGWTTPGAYPTPTALLLWLSQQPNCIIISGHTHNDWRLQSEQVTYTADGVVYVGGEMPNIKYYHVPDGAYMVNLPSMRYRTQDAKVYLYDDKVIVKARAGIYTDGGGYVNGTVDAMADNSAWVLQEMGDAYTYTIPLREYSDAGIPVYNKGGEPVSVVYNHAGEVVEQVYTK